MLKTDLCDLLGVQYPIIQGGMAWVATGELAAAVSNAGGLGIIGAGSAPKEIVRGQIKKAKELTNKPFGVNIYFISPFVDDIIDLVIEENIKIITTGAGNPGKYISRFKEAGIKVFPLVSSVALARRLEKIGVDGLIAEGLECGGHVGELTTMALVPQIVDAVNIPVIAAGGIFDARGVVAALSFGVQGVQMGTRFVCAEECTVHENYKEALIKAKDRDTVLTGTSGHKVRVVKNKLTRTFDELVENNATEEEFEKLGAGRLRMAVVDGDIQMGSIMAGQVASMIKKVQPAKEIIEEIVTETSEIINNLKRFL
ncbi:enoyl-[acyl-carrier protein] reductase II [Desulfonispora thiosulfatigenes DSM 11270]|uniref:Probable nitronate monooxygenase n=1 Tax=Desulfonispora thiosulfatigenes DSM 11270 TaxID=656914 RepID=A0A1W1VK03_DESTI|nr:enoyl-[acyl-carrier-protein] reductase FabK [Desulfonispora thiosulfatigenes]SMB93613.1 enoyl-[acyl-carrier protein] reductase II [Desulfonispora thiosulfatigenes DSM 11270]